MKKIILLLPLACLAGFVSAQIRFGLKAGYNLSTLIYSGTSSLAGEKALSGFNGGVYASIPFSKSFSLQPEILYSEQGAGFQNSGAQGKLQYDYLNIPVLVRYKLPQGLFLETGLQLGILLSAKEKNNGNDFDIRSATYSPDYAWAMGLGYQIPDKNFGVDLRYNLGLINIAKSASDVNVRNSVFQFDVFYTF
jgi:hypothetical protein